MTEEIDATTSSSSCAPVGIDLTSGAASQTAESRGRIQWPGGPSIRQSFSLPESIIYYIAKNPSSAESYMKLIQSCKYFFEKNAIIVAARIRDGSKICSKPREECKKSNGECCIDFDINKLSSKIWLTGELFLRQIPDPNYPALLCSKLYRSEIERFALSGKAVFLDDFKFLVPFVTRLLIKNVEIIKNDESIVSIDEVLEFVPKLKKFGFYFINDQSTSLKSIAKLNDLKHLTHLFLFFIPEIYSIEDVSAFVKGHKDMKICLHFHRSISEDYKDQLDVLIDGIIESEVRNQIIIYTGLEMDKYKAMVNRMDQIFKPLFV